MIRARANHSCNVQKPIGSKRHEVVHDGDALKRSSDFDFTDRDGPGQLTATLRTSANFTPPSFNASGKRCIGANPTLV